MIGLAMSYEPFPKPGFLASRDNNMVGSGGAGPNAPPALCQTTQLPGFPHDLTDVCNQ